MCNLVGFELCSDSPTFVVCKSVTVFLEQSIDSGYAAIPRVFEILQGEASIL